MQGNGIQNQVGIEIAVTNLKMLLSGNESKAIAHFQQVTGDVLNQLLFYVPFPSFQPNQRCTGLSTGNWQGRFEVQEAWL